MPVRLPPRVRERIPVVCIVYNDRGLGNERAFQKELYGERVTEPSGVLPAVKRALLAVLARESSMRRSGWRAIWLLMGCPLGVRVACTAAL
jgi:hypothetical protein